MRLPRTSAKHFGVSAVAGMSRCPRPAPMMIARTTVARRDAGTSRPGPSSELTTTHWFFNPGPLIVSDIAGTWSDDEQWEFEANTRVFEQLDDEMWER